MEESNMDLSSLRFSSEDINSLEIDAKHKLILKQLLAENDVNKIEDKAKDMLPEKTSNILGKNTEWMHFIGGQGSSNDKIFKTIKCEVYKFLCTKSREYAKERNSLSSGMLDVIKVLAGAIALSIGGIPLTVITAIIAALLMAALKIGQKSWCIINANVCDK